MATIEKREDTHYQYQEWKKGCHLVPRNIKRIVIEYYKELFINNFEN